MTKINKNSKSLCSTLYDKVSKNLSSGAELTKLKSEMSRYFNKNNEKLFTLYPIDRILFLEEDKNAIYRAANLSSKEIKDAIKSSEYIKDTWYILNEPLNTASILILRNFTLKKNEQMLKLFIVYYSCYFYASLFAKYLPYGANEDIMKYVVNHLSNKFMLRKEQSVYKAIEAIALKCHETYYDELVSGTDEGLAKYISGLKVRLNDFVKNIKNEYTKAHTANKTMYVESDDLSPDNFHLADNTSLIIQRYASSAINKITLGGLDIKIANMAAKLCDVSKSEIKNVINNLGDDNAKEILRLLELILQLFLFEAKANPKDINTNKFLAECLIIYKKPNTNDKIIIEIKEILDRWLVANSARYRKTNREATLSNFRKAIFLYFVLYIEINTR